VLSFHI